MFKSVLFNAGHCLRYNRYNAKTNISNSSMQQYPEIKSHTISLRCIFQGSFTPVFTLCQRNQQIHWFLWGLWKHKQLFNFLIQKNIKTVRIVGYNIQYNMHRLFKILANIWLCFSMHTESLHTVYYTHCIHIHYNYCLHIIIYTVYYFTFWIYTVIM